jgi:3-(3-hydroxy-phenyl)propionate hydroxylase/flavoprotein hydroxylase
LTDGLLQEEGQLRGILGVHGSIEIDGKVSRYDDVIDRGFHLLVRGDEDPLAALDAQQQGFIRDYGLQVVRLAPQADSARGIYRDVSGKYLQFMAEAGLKVLVVRPDYYCFGGVAQLSALPKLLDSLRRQLQQNAPVASGARACHV